MKKSLSLILALAMVFAMFASVVSADDTAAATSTSVTSTTYTPQQAFDALKAAGIVEGDAVKGADLESNMTRAQFAKVIAKLWSLPEAPESSTVYSDLVGATWAKGYIGAATKAGLLNGVGGGKFNPSGNVKLEEIAKVVATGFKLTSVDYAGTGKVSTWAKGYVGAVIGAKLVADSADFTKAAKRSELFTIGYTGYVAIEGAKATPTPTPTPGPLAVSLVTGITNTKVSVTLTDAVKAVNLADFSAKDAAAKAFAVKSVTLSADGKTITVVTDAQIANTLYTLTVQGKDFTFVGQELDSTKPGLDSVVATSNTEVKVTFSENVDAASALNIANYTIAGLAVLKAAYDVDADGVIIPTTVLLTTASQSQSSIYTLVVTNVQDITGNIVDADDDELQFGGLAPDTDKPQLSSAVALTNTTVKVIFNSEKMDKATAENIANYTIAGLSVLKAELSSDKTYVTLTTASQAVSAIYTLAVVKVTDISGNVIDADHDESQFGGLAPDTDKPFLSSSVATNNTTVTATFDSEMDKATAETVANYSIEGLTISKAVLSDDKKSVALTTSAQTISTIYKLVVVKVTDLSANVIDADHDEFQFGGLAVDTDKPTVLSAVANTTSQVTVTFSELMDATTAAQAFNYYLGTELGYPTKVVKGTTADIWVLTTKAQSSKPYTLDVTGVKDTSGNVVNEDSDEATFAGVGTADTTKPKVSAAVALNKNTIKVTFNEALDDTTVAVGDFAISVVSGTEVAPVIAGATPVALLVSDDKKSVTLQYATAVTTAGVVYKVTVTGVNDAATPANTINASADNTSNFGGTSADNAAPKVSTAVALNNQTLAITFSEPVKLGTITSADFTFGNPASSPPVTFSGTFVGSSLSTDKKTLTVYYSGATTTPTNTFQAGKLYTVTVGTTNVQDELGVVALSSTSSANVGTLSGVSGGIISPKISSIVAVNKNTIDVTFNQKVTSALIHSDLSDVVVYLNDGTTVVANAEALIRTEGDAGNKIRIFFPTDFAAGTVYKVTLNAADITNANGTVMATADNTAAFAGIATVNAAPTVTSVTYLSPTTIKVTLSEAVTGVDVTGANTDFVITGVSFDGGAVVSTDGKEITLTATAGFGVAGIKTLTVGTTSIKDEAGIAAIDPAASKQFVNP